MNTLTEQFVLIQDHIRLGVFLTVFIVIALWERVRRRKATTAPTLVRWINNLALVSLNTALLKIGLPLMATGVAVWASERQFGLFNFLELPPALEILIAVILLDLAIYWQHVIFHRVPLLWRLHRMHHADTDLDVTSGLRFHPIEIYLSMLIKMTLVALLGAHIVAVILFEIILNAMAVFNHGNIYLPLRADSIIRKVFVTPDMHRVHHSVHRNETDSNFGFNLSFWDRLFGTYCAQPKDGHDNMQIGLKIFREHRELRLDRLITLPFRQGRPSCTAGNPIR